MNLPVGKMGWVYRRNAPVNVIRRVQLAPERAGLEI